MLVSKCDVCKKEITTGKRVVAGTGYFQVMELCYTCGASVIELLKKHKFKYLSKDEKEKK